MSDTKVWEILWCAVLAIAFALWLAFNLGVTLHEIEAIERGYALHCHDTGDFAWKGECDE